jgi:hypothetical protein
VTNSLVQILTMNEGIIPLSVLQILFSNTTNTQNIDLKSIILSKNQIFKVYNSPNTNFGVCLWSSHENRNTLLYADIDLWTKVWIRNIPTDFDFQKEFSTVGSIEFFRSDPYLV